MRMKCVSRAKRQKKPQIIFLFLGRTENNLGLLFCDFKEVYGGKFLEITLRLYGVLRIRRLGGVAWTRKEILQTLDYE